MRAPVNPVWALCCALGIASAIALPLVRVAPNRLLSGEPVFLAELLGTWSAAAWLLPLFLLGLGWRQRQAFTPRLASGNLLTSALMAIFVASLLGLAGRHASHIAATESAYARTSLGAGFWCLIILAILLSLDAVSQSRRSALRRYLWFALLALPTIILVASGFTDELSVLKEYANRSEVFWKETLRHLQIVGLATVPSVLIGLPLGWACSRSAATQKTIFPFLNIVQTVPSLAIFGLLMGPLAWAASQFAWLGRAGISGVGLAPAVLTLLVYSLLPIVRSALAGLQQVPVAATTAARAMGMSAWQIFYRIELPLALPVVLPGLRTAVVQTIGLAAITALVGAGGLGALMFDGLFSAANELVLLGVLPVVAMAVIADAAFKGLTALADPLRGLQPVIVDAAPPTSPANTATETSR